MRLANFLSKNKAVRDEKKTKKKSTNIGYYIIRVKVKKDHSKNSLFSEVLRIFLPLYRGMPLWNLMRSYALYRNILGTYSFFFIFLRDHAKLSRSKGA